MSPVHQSSPLFNPFFQSSVLVQLKDLVNLFHSGIRGSWLFQSCKAQIIKFSLFKFTSTLNYPILPRVYSLSLSLSPIPCCSITLQTAYIMDILLFNIFSSVAIWIFKENKFTKYFAIATICIAALQHLITLTAT